MSSISEVDWSSLPEEVWSYILGYLSTGSLSQVALVSKRLNKLSTDPLLWASKQINLNKAKVINRRPFLSFLNIPRFAKIKKLDLSGMCFSLDFAEALFGYINSSTCQITSINLSSVSISDHMGFERIGFKDNSVKIDEDCGDAQRDLFLNCNPDFDGNSVGRAIAKLEDSKLADFMRIKQSSSRFTLSILENAMTTSHHQSIDLTGFDFSRVSPPLFSSAIASLKRVKLLDCPGITSEHITALFAFLANQESPSLSLLFLAGIPNILPQNPASELARGISKLEHVHLVCNQKMELDKVLAVLQAVPKSNLQSLNIGMYVKGVPMQVIRNAVLHLNPRAMGDIPNKCKSIDDQFKIWKLLFGNNIFDW